MLAWLLHHLRWGARARNSVLAYCRSLAMLSSQRMITLPGKEPNSSATAPTGRRPRPQVAMIHDGERAEIAIVRTAARGKQNSSRVIAPVKQVFPRHGSMFQTRGFRGTVLVAIPSGIKVAQELRPLGFGLTDKDYVRMRLCLIGHQSYMRSSQYDR